MKTARILPLLTVLATAAPAAAQAPDTVPSPARVLGHELGERFTDHAGVVRYMEALDAASPRVEVRRYGTTAEGRPLLQVVIAREDHLARLDEILGLNRELADPATPAARAREIAARNPAIVYLSYGVHGNESSSSEAAMWTAWDLARGAETVAGVLDSVVVVIDPAVNPDGRDRYVGWYRQAVGMEPNASPEAREHFEPWPGGRYNHYLFDLNRDWAWMSQPETQARIASWDTWMPQVHVDFHEMGWTSSYFFFPAAKPLNPIYPEHTLKWARRIGEGNARAFDEHGWLYFTGESYDLFYPGYGDSWPSLMGAIGMTYEQAGGGRAGLAIERPDGTTLTLRDRASHHRTAGEATLRTVARSKSELLLDYARFHRTVGDGQPDVLLVAGADASRAEALVDLLRRQGILVQRASRAFRADAEAHPGFPARREFPAGTYRVPARQPRGRLATTLLQPETVLDATFSYDISAWSLPFAYGVEAHRAGRVPDAGWQNLDEATATVAAKAAPTATAGEPYGYLVAPSFSAWPALVRFLVDGGRGIVLDEPFHAAGRAWPAGTFFLPRFLNADLSRRVREAALDAHAVPTSTGFTPDGNDLGTEDAYLIERPEVAVLTGDGVSPTSYGTHWFFLERTLGLPFDALPADRLGAADLGRYDVLVLPDLGRAALDEARLERIKTWVRRGGTLVAVAGAAAAVAEEVAGIKLRRDDDAAADTASALRGRKARELERWEQEVPGTILAVRLDPAHPLAFGAGVDGDPERMYVLHNAGRTFEPDDAFESVAYFPDGLEKVSGVISERNLERLSRSAWLATRRVGDGRVILFADDPLFRHFWYAGFQPYTNALLIGPHL
ncbi:MAG TPA: M14 family metallopeptidase [Longimicrobiales bacterium]